MRSKLEEGMPTVKVTSASPADLPLSRNSLASKVELQRADWGRAAAGWRESKRPAKLDTPRGPKRALSSGANASPAQHNKVDINRRCPVHLDPRREQRAAHTAGSIICDIQM